MIGYIAGDTRIASLTKDSISISVPKGETASLMARILGSGSISVKLGENSALSLSIVDESREDSHKLNLDFKLGKNSRYAQTSNFRGLCRESELKGSGLCGEKSRLALNSIFAGGSRTGASLTIACASECASQVNLLTLPQNASQSIRTDMRHTGNSSKNAVLCSGVVPDSSSVEFNGSLSIPERTKDIESSLHGKFIAYPGAKVRALPVLKVHSKDVRTAHGVSVTNISRDELSYLQSRGIPEKDARSLIERGSIESMLNRMSASIGCVLKR